jgi:hypothetical protein
MVEVPPEIKNVIDQQEASLQRIAIWIIGASLSTKLQQAHKGPTGA